MRRVHLLEIHDQPWCPRSLRDALTDFLQFTINLGRSYAAVAPLLRDAIARAGATRVVDLCSGAGGPWRTLRHEIPVPVVLTDKYPNRAARAGTLPFHSEPVDATAVPVDLRGFRTLFTSFHHFPPPEARAILADAVHRGQGIGRDLASVVVDAARERGLRQVIVRPVARNSAAIGFFHSRGFTAMGQVELILDLVDPGRWKPGEEIAGRDFRV